MKDWKLNVMCDPGLDVIIKLKKLHILQILLPTADKKNEGLHWLRLSGKGSVLASLS
jgi:hypothetical protein